MNTRRCEEAVVRSRSIDSSVMLIAVSAPIDTSVPNRSLSIVEATPTTGRPSAASAAEPLCEPLPPITTSASMPRAASCARARSRAAFSRNSGERALPSTVPPRWMMPPTSRAVSGVSASASNPA